LVDIDDAPEPFLSIGTPGPASLALLSARFRFESAEVAVFDVVPLEETAAAAAAAASLSCNDP
jgi:hypothetical protein